jgi:hypothetical protein
VVMCVGSYLFTPMMVSFPSSRSESPGSLAQESFVVLHASSVAVGLTVSHLYRRSYLYLYLYLCRL